MTDLLIRGAVVADPHVDVVDRLRSVCGLQWHQSIEQVTVTVKKCTDVPGG